MADWGEEMVTYKGFKPGILAVLVFILLTGLTTAALAQEETTETSRMNQSSTSEENESVSQMRTIVLINNAFDPETMEINQYDTVVWRNLNKPKRSFVLVSEDNLWEDFTLGYGKSFEYTFNETGNFGFSIQGERGLEGTVAVSESRETTEAPLSERETQPQIQQEETEQQEEEEVTPSPTEEVTPGRTAEEVQSSENSVLIRESAFYPETLELNTGETVVWKNLNRPKRSFTLVSEEGLFEDPVLGYGKSFSYTFDEAGEYTFKLEEDSGSELVLTVE
jgi:plastocyanin